MAGREVIIGLWDEQGNPVPAQRFAVRDSGGSIIREDRLDINGQARIVVHDDEVHQVWFPDLHASEWETTSWPQQ